MERLRCQLLAIELMTKHGLIAKGWRFEFDRGRRRIGCCYHNSKLITLSAYFTDLNDEEAMKDTILHEIAHSLAGFEAGHSWQWRMVARNIGAKDKRCADTTVVSPPANYTGCCLDCGMTYTAHRIGCAMPRKRCVKCWHYQESTKGLLVWKDTKGNIVYHPETGFPIGISTKLYGV